MQNQSHNYHCVDYTSFRVPDGSLPDISNCVGLIRGTVDASSVVNSGYSSLESLLLKIPDGYELVDLSAYKVKPRNPLLWS